MAYKALYNKYRPMTFEEVAGQKAIVRTLRNAINNNKLAHAYLFCGPRGTGKTTMARLIAKALNCEQGVGCQCNECSNCLALNSGSHPDVIEIDAASNNGVDQVRDLIDKVRYSPIKGRMKIYIIDEVHMMSQGAFNALLKTLEEPPEHVIFILATTEPHKVLPTILSRCQRYDFGKIDDADLKEKLIWVLNNEGVPFEEPALNEIVALADGGMRDSLSILDQALAYGGDALRQADVLQVFGLTSTKEKIALLKLVAAGDVANVLKKLQDFLDAGIDIKRLCASLLDVLKDLLIYKKTKSSSLLTVTKESEIQDLGKSVSVKFANEMIDVLLKTQIDFKSVSNIRSLFELALLQLTALSGNEPEIKEDPIVPLQQPVVPQAKPEPEKPAVLQEKPAETKPKEVKKEPETAAYDPNSGMPYLGTTVPDFLVADDEPEEEEPAPQVEPKAAEPVAPVVEPKRVEAEPFPTHEKAAPQAEPLPKKEEKVHVQQAPEPAPIPEATYTAPFDVSGIQHRTITNDGELQTLDDNTVVNIMVLGSKFKTERQELFAKWSAFADMKLDAELGDVATLLSEGKPFCLTAEALLVNFNFTKKRDIANFKENQPAIADMIEALLGRRVFVYALDRQDSNRCQSLYFSLKQVGKLPSAENITLDIPKGE
ncbi:MAG: DNA polymerase III subunit gamma/tau [Bacilli bacterium]|nr:DNA polymerase III subunit gamma/tau [Bacilli bacterium]